VVDAGAASYNPNSRRIAEMIQNDWSKVGIKAKIVTYEWGEYLAGMRKGEHDSALFGWMSDNGDPDNFANTLLSCDNIKTGSNVARWCDKSYDALVKQAILVSDPQARAKLYAQAQEIFISRPLGSLWRPARPSTQRAATSAATA
jgi:ABC-type transport system substrate-binding protein